MLPKRKRDDLSNESTITLDARFDLTLIVGKEDSPNGQKRFQINSNSLRMTSPVFGAMFSGKYAESAKKEIEFPDDDCDAFYTFLLICHFKIQDLPEKLSLEALTDLATLCDKYDLTSIVLAYVHMKGWIGWHRPRWLDGADLVDYASITSIFKFKADYQYITNLFVLKIETRNNGSHFYRKQEDTVELPLFFPESFLRDILDARKAMLGRILELCEENLTLALTMDRCPARSAECAAMMIGIMIQELKELSLYPLPNDSSGMHRSIRYYVKGFQKMKARDGTSRTGNVVDRYYYRHQDWGCTSHLNIIDGIYTKMKDNTLFEVWNDAKYVDLELTRELTFANSALARNQEK